MMKITNVMGLPEGLVKAASIERHNAPGSISATTLLHGVKAIHLTNRHWEELEDDVSDRIWAIWGTAVHALLEHEGETDFTEVSMSHDFLGVKITGRIDNFDMGSGTVRDYKTASMWKVKFQDFDDWYKQGMVYAWLLSKNGFPAKKCQFIAMLKDHSKSKAKRDSSYPQEPMYLYEFEVTPEGLTEIEAFIAVKVNQYLQNLPLGDDDIPECSPEERWEDPPQFAVMKQGRKSAVKLFDTREPAEAMIDELGHDKHYLEERPGEPKKCEDYCVCNEYCSFYKKFKAFLQAAEAVA
jgi:hypothetical protein